MSFEAANEAISQELHAIMAEIGQDIAKAKYILENGGLVAVPTETVYGLAANGLNAKAVAKVFEAKKRPSFNPLILHMNSIQTAKEIVESIPEEALDLAKQFWPGPLTMVLKKKFLYLTLSPLDWILLLLEFQDTTLQDNY